MQNILFYSGKKISRFQKIKELKRILRKMDVHQEERSEEALEILQMIFELQDMTDEEYALDKHNYLRSLTLDKDYDL